MAWLKAVPLWLWVSIGAVVLLSVQEVRISAVKTQLSDLRRDYSEHLRADADARAAKEAEYRHKEAEAQNKINKVRDDAKEELKKSEIARTAANSAADSLRVQLAKIRGRAATEEATSALGSKARAPIIGVLTELLGESNQRNTVYAAALDRSRTAGLACEKSYDALGGA